MSDTASVISGALAAAGGSEAVASSSSEPTSTTSTDTATSAEDTATETQVADPSSDSAASTEAAPIEQATPGDTEAVTTLTEKTKGPIPFDRHTAVLTRTRNEHAAALQARDAELASLKWVKDIPHAEHKMQAMAIAETDPQRFVEILKRLDPEKYGSLTFGQAQAKAATEQPASTTLGDMPQPDVTLEDGSSFYSATAQHELVKWMDAKHKSEMKLALDERFRPMDEDKAHRQAMTEAHARQTPVLAEARKRPLFKEHETEIKAAIVKNLDDIKLGMQYGRAVPILTLDQAYINIVLPKLQAQTQINRDQTRKELLAEINASPKAATLRPGVAAVPAATGSGSATASTADLIRASLRR